MGTAPFRVAVRGFTGLPDHSIFFRIERTPALRQLTADLRSLQRQLQPDAEHKPQFFMEPNITLATRLKPAQYEQAWAEYAHRHFTADFIADGLLVLRRNPGETRFQVLSRLEFKNLPVVTRQGELFA
jgi:2'-5' RNA ligase